MSSDKYYVGSTHDELSERIRRHNSNHKGYTGKAFDWEIKYTEEFATIESVLKRDKELEKQKTNRGTYSRKVL